MQKRMHLNAAVGSVNKINNMRLMINIQRSVECHNRRAWAVEIQTIAQCSEGNTRLNVKLSIVA